MDDRRARHADRGERATLIHARYIVPVRPAGVVHEAHSVAIRDGLILGVKPRAEAERDWPLAAAIELPEHVLLPGLVNCHTHSPMTLLRGYADDLDLHVWLKEHIWPAEREFVGPEFVRDGSLLAIAEMFRSGTTCFNDMYFFPDATVEACVAAGMRASIGITVIEIETAWARNADEYIERGLRLRDACAGTPLITFAFSPHAPYTVSDATLGRIAGLSGELGIPVHMHLLETEWEIKQSFQQHDRHPLGRLEQSGLLNSSLQAVHMVQLSAEDIDQLARSGVQVVHCPQSNLKLASGFCPVVSLQAAGVNVALGTDGAASNNDLDLLAEAQSAALLAKGVSGDARAGSASTIIDMLTINGARVLGLDAHIGSIEAGKQADFCALDLHAPETQPLHHVLSQLVYAASSRQVSDVWVAGRRVLESGRLTTIDTDEVIARARSWQAKLAGLEQRRQRERRQESAT
jgi:5-methylthioadenosine/S-adenosylhomocysteine deaminase